MRLDSQQNTGCFNPKMLILARKFREVTQLELNRATGISQAQLSKIELGVQVPTDDALKALSSALHFPTAFFRQNDNYFPPITPFHRKRAKLGKKSQERAEALANLKRIHITRLLTSVNVEGMIPKIDLGELDDDPAKAAKTIRRYFKLPSGPVENMVGCLEEHGVFVFLESFASKELDGFTLIGNGVNPIIFLNSSFPGDRERLTLAHELGHIVMHEIITEEVENEAWAFASEFLMPADEIHEDLAQAKSLNDYADLKRKWKISMAALIRRSYSLGVINSSKYTYFMQCMGPYRKLEPVSINQEKPTLLQELLDVFTDEFNYSQEALAEALCIEPDLYTELYNVKNSRFRILKR